jgi:hypothetical protein
VTDLPAACPNSGLMLVPLTLSEANRFVEVHHRHNRPVVGARFSIGAVAADRLVGAAIVGRPVSRAFDWRTVAEVTRTCTAPDAPKNTNSLLYGACWRAWRAMGGLRLVTYTLASESGASLRGSGFRVVAECKAKSNPWQGPDRQREFQDVYGQVKFRWERAAR